MIGKRKFAKTAIVDVKDLLQIKPYVSSASNPYGCRSYAEYGNKKCNPECGIANWCKLVKSALPKLE